MISTEWWMIEWWMSEESEEVGKVLKVLVLSGATVDGGLEETRVVRMGVPLEQKDVER